MKQEEGFDDLRLSEGENALTLSPGRERLAWARISRLFQVSHWNALARARISRSELEAQDDCNHGVEGSRFNGFSTLFAMLQAHEMELGRLTLHEESDKRKKGLSLKASNSQM
ncbi:hypothetical protein Lal_00021323 [Lupinus albus]|nr:hypothetical protein Lal_00021323 [Lupinus albus]